MEEGEQVDVAYLDFRCAFDFVPHLRLLQKLHDMGVRARRLLRVASLLPDGEKIESHKR